MLYFIEGERSYTRGLVKEYSLGSLIDQPTSVQTLRGPDGKSGLLLKDFSDDAELRCVESEQAWAPRHGFPGCHVGRWNVTPPSEGGLARSQFLAGPRLKLLDGGLWQVPQLRYWATDTDDDVIFGCNLPRVLRQDPETGGFVEGEVKESYRAIWDESCRIAEALLDQIAGGSKAAELDDTQVDRYVASILNLNYRIDGSGIGLLGLLDRQLLGEIIRISIDWETLLEILKKKTVTNRPDGGERALSSSGGATPQTVASPTLTPQL